MRRRYLAIVLIVVAAAACTSGSSDGESASEGGTDPTAASPATTTAVLTEESTTTAPGQVVILGASDAIIVVDPDGSDPRTLYEQGPSELVRQPTWSPDGTAVAWSTASMLAGEPARIWINDRITDESRSIDTAAAAFYLDWSGDGSEIAWLGNGTEGVGLGVVDSALAADVADDYLAQAVPHFVDWDGSEIVAHQGNSSLRRVDGERAIGLSDTDTAFATPAVLPNREILIARSADGGDVTLASTASTRTPRVALAIVAADGATERVVAELSGERIGFDVDAEGRRAAVWSLAGARRGWVDVVDLATGDVSSVATEGAVLARWSPTGASLGVLVVEPDRTFRWRVSSPTGTGAVELPGFSLSGRFIADYLPFWDQFSRSITPWSPDGRALVVVDGGGEVRVQYVDEPGRQVVVADDGEVAWWSPAGGAARP